MNKSNECTRCEAGRELNQQTLQQVGFKGKGQTKMWSQFLELKEQRSPEWLHTVPAFIHLSFPPSCLPAFFPSFLPSLITSFCLSFLPSSLLSITLCSTSTISQLICHDCVRRRAWIDVVIGKRSQSLETFEWLELPKTEIFPLICSDLRKKDNFHSSTNWIPLWWQRNCSCDNRSQQGAVEFSHVPCSMNNVVAVLLPVARRNKHNSVVFYEAHMTSWSYHGVSQTTPSSSSSSSSSSSPFFVPTVKENKKKVWYPP